MAHARLNDDRLTRYFLLFRGTEMVEWHYWRCTTQSAASHVRSRQRWCRCLVLLAYERQARPFQERSRLAANEFGDVFSRRSLGQIAIPSLTFMVFVLAHFHECHRTSIRKIVRVSSLSLKHRSLCPVVQIYFATTTSIPLTTMCDLQSTGSKRAGEIWSRLRTDSR